MKKTILSITAVFMMAISFAQTALAPKDPSLGFGFFQKDFLTPVNIHTYGFSHVLDRGNLAKPSDMSFGLNLHYYKGITSNLDFKASLGGCFSQYGYGPDSLSSKKNLVLDLNAEVHVKMFTDKAWINPYAIGGLGLAEFNTSYLFGSINAGGGIEINVCKSSFIYVQAVYDFVVTHKYVDNLNYSIGYAHTLTKKAKSAKSR